MNISPITSAASSPNDALSRAARSHAQPLRGEHGEHGARPRRTLDSAATPKAPLRGSGSPEPLPSGERPFSFLGTVAKSVDGEAQKAKRKARFHLLDTAATLLPKERVAHCQRKPAGSAVAVLRSADGHASIQGLQTCGSVAHCPICSSRISSVRRDELNRLLKWARRHHLVPLLLTLTGRHTLHDTLERLLDAMKGAKKRLHQSRHWRALADLIDGHVTATELNYGCRHGWHVHFHTLVLVRAADEREALALFHGLRAVWERALEKEGLDCNDHGFDIQGAASAGDYIAKWGAAEELTLSGAKKARDPDKGRTVWELLSAAGGRPDEQIGREQATALWREYARLFKGRRQLVWSRGLKARAGVSEKSDEELAAEVEKRDLIRMVEVGRLTAAEWRRIIRTGLRCDLLEAVEKDGQAGFERILLRSGSFIRN